MIQPVNTPLTAVSTLLLTLLLTVGTSGQSLQETRSERDARMRWWREARFGMFIHWGVYAIPAQGEWYMFNKKIPVAEYEKYPPQFNPVQYDARSWVRMAREAGMKYIVITSKHHDGFCMWDSRVSTYDIIDRTPFGRDPLKELAAACKAEGVTLCFYHSILDWHHPDATGARFPRYREEYLKPQLKELITGYGPLGVLWFDGDWISEWSQKDGKELYAYVRSLQKNIIVNNRVGKGRVGMEGFSLGPEAAGDFGTPEQQVPATGLDGVDWESCITMNDNWGFNASDSNWKSTRTLVRQLVDIASKGGNYLLNVGPTALGSFPPESIVRLKEIGRWMKTNGEAIYGTGASCLHQTPWGRCTTKKLPGGRTRLYLHVFDWPADGRIPVSGLGSTPTRARILGSKQARCTLASTPDSLLITVERLRPDSLATVIALDFKGEVVTFHPPSLSSDLPIFLDRATVTMSSRSPGLQIRYTQDGSEPTLASPLYEHPVVLSASTLVHARCFYRGRGVSSTATLEVRQATPAPPQPVSRLLPGLLYAYYEGSWEKLPDFEPLTPVSTGIADTVSLSMRKREEFFAVTLKGLIEVPETSVYSFTLISDDGSALRIDGKELIQNDGLHSSAVRTQYAPLEKGPHRVEIRYFNGSGGAELGLTVAEARKGPLDLRSLLFHEP